MSFTHCTADVICDVTFLHMMHCYAIRYFLAQIAGDGQQASHALSCNEVFHINTGNYVLVVGTAPCKMYGRVINHDRARLSELRMDGAIVRVQR